MNAQGRSALHLLLALVLASLSAEGLTVHRSFSQARTAVSVHRQTDTEEADDSDDSDEDQSDNEDESDEETDAQDKQTTQTQGQEDQDSEDDAEAKSAQAQDTAQTQGQDGPDDPDDDEAEAEAAQAQAEADRAEKDAEANAQKQDADPRNGAGDSLSREQILRYLQKLNGADKKANNSRAQNQMNNGEKKEAIHAQTLDKVKDAAKTDDRNDNKAAGQSQTKVNGDGQKNDHTSKDSDDSDDGDDDADEDLEWEPPAGPHRAGETAVGKMKLSLLAAKPETPTGLAKEEEKLEKHMSKHAKGKAWLEKHVRKAEDDLAANVHKQKALKDRLKALSGNIINNVSDSEIETEAEQVANETQSPALGDMMGSMWKDMRMFEVPSYTKQAEEELRRLEDDQSKLEDKVKAARHILGNDKGKYEEKKEKKEEVSDQDSGKNSSGATSSWNFWRMNPNQQASFFGGSLIYIIGGVMLAFLYNSVRSKIPMLTAEHRPETPRTDQFSFSLFGCFATPHISVMGCCCPCLQWADTMDRGTMDGKPLLTYWKAFGAFFGLLTLHGYSWGVSWLALVAMGVWFRQKLRENYVLENRTPGSVGMDILAWVFCQPCAIIQEARERSSPV